METPKGLGQRLQSEEAEVRREAARILGQSKSERKAASSRENGKKSLLSSKVGTHIVTEEMRAKMSAAQKARWERVRQEAGIISQPTEKRPPGRPRTRPVPDPDAPKRPVGRPKKATPHQDI